VLTVDSGVSPSLVLGTASEYNFGPNTYPEGVVSAGGFLWVPLYGGYGASAAAAGQYLARLTVDSAGNLADAGVLDLRTLDLKTFDGGKSSPKPAAVTATGGAVYAVLNNLNPDTYDPAGPGLLARADQVTGALTEVDLGAACLNPGWAVPVGDGGLAVTCSGDAVYDLSWSVVSLANAGVVLLNANGAVTSFWSASCPADAGTLVDGGPACVPFMPGRFAVRGSRLLIGDTNSGRIAVLDVIDGGLVEVRGAASAVAVCPSINVGDVLALP
jgi:hypothetical protein